MHHFGFYLLSLIHTTYFITITFSGTVLNSAVFLNRFICD